MSHILLDTVYNEFNNRNLLSKAYSKTFATTVPLSKHIEGLIKSKLSQQVHWKYVKAKEAEIDSLFYNYDETKMRAHNSNYYLSELEALKVGRFRKNLCDNLFNNIDYIKSILILRPILESDLLILAKNLKGFGIPLVCEYFVYIGIDRVKPDLQVKRILSRYYDGVNKSKNFDDKKTLDWAHKVRAFGKYNLTQVDILLWGYCTEPPEGLEICGDKPKCSLCKLAKTNGGNCRY